MAWTWGERGILKAELYLMQGFWWVLDQTPLQSDDMGKWKRFKNITKKKKKKYYSIWMNHMKLLEPFIPLSVDSALLWQIISLPPLLERREFPIKISWHCIQTLSWYPNPGALRHKVELFFFLETKAIKQQQFRKIQLNMVKEILISFLLPPSPGPITNENPLLL